MSDRWFDDYEIGETWVSHGRTIGEADIVNFAGVSGDFHPAVMDVEFGRRSGFGGRIAHGALIFSVVLGIAWQVKQNTRNFTYGFDRIRFPKPVFAGDTIRVRGTVTELADYSKRPALGFVVMRLEGLNQRDEVVLVADHRMLVERRVPTASTAAAVMP